MRVSQLSGNKEICADIFKSKESLFLQVILKQFWGNIYIYYIYIMKKRKKKERKEGGKEEGRKGGKERRKNERERKKEEEK